MKQQYLLRLATLAAIFTTMVPLSQAQVTPPPPAANDTLFPKSENAPEHIIRNADSVGGAPSNAQQVVPAMYVNKYTPGQFVREFVPYVKSPLRWNVGKWAIFAGVGAATVSVMQFDEQIRQWSVKQKPHYGDRVEYKVGEQWGGFFFIPITSVLLYSHGWIADNHKTKKLGFEIAQAAAYSEIISFTAKNIFNRARPFLNRGPFQWDPLSGDKVFNSPHNSFPAGHVNAAMALSVVLARNTHSPLLKILSFTPTVLTAAERVLNDVHWTSDVFIGAALGYATATWVCNYHEHKEMGLQVSSVYPLGVKYVFK
jgi:membrane-associated phospholipid phosphatase